MKLAVVTGTSRGLGRAVAAELIEKGYQVLGLGRTSSSELDACSSYRHVAFDLGASETSMPPILTALEKYCIRSELVFIHNASVIRPVGLISHLTQSDVRTGMEINLVAPILLSQAILRYCEGKKVPLRMIHISSSAAERAIPGLNLYAVAKAGLEMLVRSIHSESSENGGVICIGFRPGRMNTEMQAEMRSFPESEFPAVGRYQDSYEMGLLTDPGIVAAAFVEKLVLPPVESGRIYSYEELK